ncbi:diaminobutyrate acetyltransferase [Brevibacillus massiliensis]|uniref:diaminobutyrate acetyltransferase n=1 Tax=Brevibacillus massiliensis TaxID=1118054 RepID=UPI0002D4D69C|nr:diaminobutyrate acetyltransferase [Brevibacillus massiliensis]
MNTAAREDTRVTIRKASAKDGAAMWRLVAESRVLDPNSPYAYLMAGNYFSETCVVAEWEEQLIGFVTAFCLPDEPDTLFVWQIGVSEGHRGQGIGSSMLRELLARDACRHVRYLEATVTSSNEPSKALFRRLAAEMGTACEVKPCFPASLFPGQDHEAEWTYRIGPLHKAR